MWLISEVSGMQYAQTSKYRDINPFLEMYVDDVKGEYHFVLSLNMISHVAVFGCQLPIALLLNWGGTQ